MRAQQQRTRVIGYVRVSTEGQVDAGVSLDAQRAKLEAYAALYDLELAGVVEDPGASAKTLDRPGLQQALALLEAGAVEGLLVAKLDRLTRSVRDLGSLLDRGFRDRWALLSVSENVDTRSAAGRLVLNVLCSVAEWEREAIGERTSAALQHIKRAEGACLGGVGLGWTRSQERDEHGRQRVVEVQAEARTVARMLELREQGRTLREIAQALEEEGHSTKQGKRWHAATVKRVLDRARRQVAA